MVGCEVHGGGLGAHAVLSIHGEWVTYDTWITGDGQTSPRKASKSHEVTQKEAMAVAQNARVLVIGTGCLGKVRVNSAVLSALAERGITPIVAPTPEAVAQFNAADGPRAAIFHVHC